MIAIFINSRNECTGSQMLCCLLSILALLVRFLIPSFLMNTIAYATTWNGSLTLHYFTWAVSPSCGDLWTISLKHLCAAEIEIGRHWDASLAKKKVWNIPSLLSITCKKKRYRITLDMFTASKCWFRARAVVCQVEHHFLCILHCPISSIKTIKWNKSLWKYHAWMQF